MRMGVVDMGHGQIDGFPTPTWPRRSQKEQNRDDQAKYNSSNPVDCSDRTHGYLHHDDRGHRPHPIPNPSPGSIGPHCHSGLFSPRSRSNAKVVILCHTLSRHPIRSRAAVSIYWRLYLYRTIQYLERQRRVVMLTFMRIALRYMKVTEMLTDYFSFKPSAGLTGGIAN